MIPGETLTERHIRLAGAFNKGHFADENVDKLVSDIESTFQAGREVYGYLKYIGNESENDAQSAIATTLRDRFIEKIKSDDSKLTLQDLYTLKDMVNKIYLESDKTSGSSRALFLAIDNELMEKIKTMEPNNGAAPFAA